MYSRGTEIFRFHNPKNDGSPFLPGWFVDFVCFAKTFFASSRSPIAFFSSFSVLALFTTSGNSNLKSLAWKKEN